MAEKRRQALLLQKYEEPAGAVREYLWFHDKAKKGYKGKVVTESMRKVAADLYWKRQVEKNFANCSSHLLRFYFRSGSPAI